jgi:hypothetical protein
MGFTWPAEASSTHAMFVCSVSLGEKNCHAPTPSQTTVSRITVSRMTVSRMTVIQSAIVTGWCYRNRSRLSPQMPSQTIGYLGSPVLIDQA